MNIAFAETSQAQILLKNSSNELRNLRGSRSQSRLTDTLSRKASDKSSYVLAQNLSKIALKNRVLISTYADQSYHKRTTSEAATKLSSIPSQIKATLDVYESFLKKLEKIGSIENQVSELICFFQESSKICSFFSGMLEKVSEIVKQYQIHVKNLDSTRIEMQEFFPEPKNVVFKSDAAKMMKYKPRKKRFSDSCAVITQDESQLGLLETKGKIVIPKLVTRSKRDKNERVFDVPGLNLVKTEQIDFHEEFMNKFDEFSESWRAAALKIKRTD